MRPTTLFAESEYLVTRESAPALSMSMLLNLEVKVVRVVAVERGVGS